jgi:hypothetical protein
VRADDAELNQGGGGPGPDPHEQIDVIEERGVNDVESASDVDKLCRQRNEEGRAYKNGQHHIECYVPYLAHSTLNNVNVSQGFTSNNVAHTIS